MYFQASMTHSFFWKNQGKISTGAKFAKAYQLPQYLSAKTAKAYTTANNVLVKKQHVKSVRVRVQDPLIATLCKWHSKKWPLNTNVSKSLLFMKNWSNTSKMTVARNSVALWNQRVSKSSTRNSLKTISRVLVLWCSCNVITAQNFSKEMPQILTSLKNVWKIWDQK